MRNRTENRHTATRELPRDARAETILEFVYNDEEEALCNEDVMLGHQSAMPAIQEFLQEMRELGSRLEAASWH